MGLLTNEFRQLPGVQRTPCPINSFAVTGPDAELYLADVDSDTCTGPGSVFERMYENDALIVGLGERLEGAASVFHYAEELVGQPYRYFRTVAGIADFGLGPTRTEKRVYVRRRDLPCEFTFGVPVEELRQQGKIQQIDVGMGFIETGRARSMVDCLAQLLKDDPLVLLSDPKEYETCTNQRSFSLVGSTNLDLIGRDLTACHIEVMGEVCRLIGVEFGQYRQAILDVESDLRVANPGYVVFLERLEDLISPAVLRGTPDESSEDLQKAVMSYADTIRQARELLDGVFLVADLSPTQVGLWDGSATMSHQIEEANRLLRRTLAELTDVHILDFDQLVSYHGAQRAFAGKFWYQGRVPFSKSFSHLLCRALLGSTLALEGATARLLVVDLENTLWGGVVGDDGLEGIQVGGDFPGNLFAEWQRYLKSLTEAGFVLAVCSKNEASIAMQAIDEHDGMILRSDDFAAFRINWQDKATNIRDICEEIGLGTYSVMFLDDNPVERAWVRERLPECTVPELPADVSEWIGFVSRLPHLHQMVLTETDRRRSRTYVQMRKTNELRAGATSREDFLGSLSMSCSIESYGPQNSARVLQLIAKTNQFNTTTIRRGRAEVQSLVSEGFTSVLAISLQDRFLERDLIGVLILKSCNQDLEIDSFVLSCRVLGRDLETAIVTWTIEQARRLGMKRVIGHIVKTPRSGPSQDVFSKCGFRQTRKGVFTFDLPQDLGPGHPDYITVQAEDLTF